MSTSSSSSATEIIRHHSVGPGEMGSTPSAEPSGSWATGSSNSGAFYVFRLLSRPVKNHSPTESQSGNVKLPVRPRSEDGPSWSGHSLLVQSRLFSQVSSGFQWEQCVLSLTLLLPARWAGPAIGHGLAVVAAAPSSRRTSQQKQTCLVQQVWASCWSPKWMRV